MLLMLPWQVTDFYVIPLGVFFAFAVTMVLVRFLDTAPGWVTKSAVLLALVFNVLVCGQAFGKMASYRNDTAQLLDWLKYNQQYRQDVGQGFQTATNAMEAGVAIPQLLAKETGVLIPAFPEKYIVKEIMYDPKVVYYLYNPRMGDQDLRRISQMWSVAFSSKSWTLFRRNFWVNR